jgi:hypothetical protein
VDGVERKRESRARGGGGGGEAFGRGLVEP